MSGHFKDCFWLQMMCLLYVTWLSRAQDVRTVPCMDQSNQILYKELDVKRFGDDTQLLQPGSFLYVDLKNKSSSLRPLSLISNTWQGTRVVVIGDTHGLHSLLQVGDIPNGDILIHIGDITFQSRGGPTINASRGEDLLRDFNAFLTRLPHPSKMVIAGNHDHILETLGPVATQQLLPDATYLCHSSAQAQGVRVYGSPVSVSLHTRNRAFQVERGSREEKGATDRVWEVMREGSGIDILVTHAADPFQVPSVDID